ncbi:MAG: ThuA domain-containing protein [Verrucomicrobia bacterium]|nr:ThuA domain-containing protein [Verrucomicrobiota bacterium]
MVAGSMVSMRAADGVVYEGRDGPGLGKHIVLLSGDEEYRSEEGLPMLGKILAVRHGFTCTVLFAIHPGDGTIDPTIVTNMPGMNALDGADLCVMLLRFRNLPESQMRPFVDYVNAGKPIVGLRTSTHAFAIGDAKSPYARYDWRSKEWPGGFGQQVLGETWVNHHGNHGRESTRGVLNPAFKDHPVLRGVTDIWGPTDVYGVVHLPADAQVLVWGQVLSGMRPSDPPVTGNKNKPMMPLAWTRMHTGERGKAARIFTTTMGASVDLASEGLRRLMVNACYWAVGLENRISERSDVRYVGDYQPTYFGFGKHVKGLKPSDHALK